MDKRITYLNGLAIIVGVWLVITAFYFPYISLGNIGQQILLGLAVILFGTARLTVPRSMWANVVNICIGFWFIIATWIIPLTSDIARWNELITGVVLIILSYFSIRITVKSKIKELSE